MPSTRGLTYGFLKPPLGTQIDRTHPLAHGLVGCWLFNDLIPLRNVPPLLGNCANGVLGQVQNTTSIGNTPYGMALTVPTTNRCGVKTLLDYNYLGTTGPFTMIALCRFDALDGNIHTIMSHGTDAFLHINQTNELALGTIGTSGGSQANKAGLSIGNYYHVTGVFTGTSSLVYIDAVPGSTLTGIDRFAVQKDFGLCANFHTFDPDSLYGAMVWAFLWTRALTQDAVEWHKAEPFAMFEDDLAYDGSFQVPTATLAIEDDGMMLYPIIGSW